MTKAEIRDILKGGIELGEITFETPEDREMALQMFKDKDPLEDILDYLQSSDANVKSGEEHIEDMQSEYDLISD